MKRLLMTAALVIALPILCLCQIDGRSSSANLLKETSVKSVPLLDSLTDERQPAQSNKQVKAGDDKESGRFWASAEYLRWKMKGSTPPPLIMVDPDVVFGGAPFNRGHFSGGRFTGGMWLNDKRNLGVEASYFTLRARTFRFQVSSNGQPSSPIIERPYIDILIGNQVSHLIVACYCGFGTSGSVSVSSPGILRGAESNLVYDFHKTNHFRSSLLAGFRYLNLNEGFTIKDVSDEITTNNPTHVEHTDQFTTRNRFYGGQVGGRIKFGWSRLALQLQSTVALGSNHETVEINGSSINTSKIPSISIGGLLALVSNIGSYQRSEFAVVPEGKAQAAIELTRHLSVSAGYDFLYSNKVVRPSDQIDPVVNSNLIPTFGGPILRGPLRPSFNFRSTRFWAQGLTTGVKVRF